MDITYTILLMATTSNYGVYCLYLPGMYPDQTLGVYRCHDAGKTRELVPANMTIALSASLAAQMG